MAYTIKEIADLAGVSTRTLRYYDEIGLLSPADVGDNGYRLYDHASLLELQQILFFRELDLPLKEIQKVTGKPDFDPLSALERHRLSLKDRKTRLDTLIETLDQTIATLKGEWIMKEKDYFNGFDESAYEEEARQRWGDTNQYSESRRKWGSFSQEEKEAIKQKGGRITTAMVGRPGSRPDDKDVQAAVEEYYQYLNKNFFTCEVEFLRNLADIWVEDPRFAINYERIREDGAEFARQAVRNFCDRQRPI